MDSRFDFKFKPFPGERFSEDAVIHCIGAPVHDHLGNRLGEVVAYDIINGEAVLSVHQDD